MAMSSNPKLPNFIVAGAAKSGSTSLYEYLKPHPEIFLPEIKESRYFAAEFLFNTLGYNKTSVFNEDRFKALYEGAGEGHKAIGDFGNIYMLYPEESIAKMKRTLGNELKIVFILRNPVKRAYSAYQMAVRNHYEDKSFEEGLELEKERLEEGYCPPDIIAYKKGGLNTEAILKFQQHFPVHVMILEELGANLQGEMSRLFEFLGVNKDFQVEEAIHNKAGALPGGGANAFKLQKKLKELKPFFGFIPGASRFADSIYKLALKTKSKTLDIPPLDRETESDLINYFREDIDRLSKLIDKDLQTLWFK